MARCKKSFATKKKSYCCVVDRNSVTGGIRKVPMGGVGAVRGGTR
jgi:hypothetical protein